MNVSIYKTLRDTNSGFIKDVYYCLNRIKTGKSKDIIESIRNCSDVEESKKIKQDLPAVCFCGTFKTRNISGLIERSGLIILDFDKFNSSKDAIKFKEKICKYEYTFAAWISPSGKGVKSLVKIETKEEHQAYFRALKEYYNDEHWDDVGKDISRLCFESYDKDLYLNKDSKIWTKTKGEEYIDLGLSNPILAVRSDNQIIERIMKWFNSNYNMYNGERNNTLYILASAFNDFGIIKSECSNVLRQYVQPDFKVSEIETVINSAYKNSHKFRSKFFEDFSRKNIVEKHIRKGGKTDELKDEFPDLSDNELERCIDKVKEDITVVDFWRYDKKGNVHLVPHKFKFWLQQHNYYKYYPNNSETYTFIRVDKNLVEETNCKRIKDYVLDNLMKRTDLGYLPYDYMANNLKFFTPDFLSLLEDTEIKIKEDTQNECFLYFKNNVVRVTNNSVSSIDYIDIDGYVWKKQIIDRDFKKVDYKNSEYRQFIWYISGQETNRYNSFKSVIGYLLHSYKTSGSNRAIIFNDETISDNPNGGSGKGLFWNALKYMKNVSDIDGKQFEFNKSFPYQTVSQDTQILVFDDVKKNFNFENLFSLITEGITLEYKGQDAIKIPVSRSPKIVITTNYTLGGNGGSFERRKLEVEMSSFFNANNTPFDVFGHLLFDDWTDKEWSMFDNYMIECVRYFLEHGLISHEFTNLETRKFIKSTSAEFYEWVNDGNLPFNERIIKSYKYSEFINEYSDYKKWLSSKRFTQWINDYCTFNGYYAKHGSDAAGRYVIIETEEAPQSEPTNNGIINDIPF